MPNWVRLWDDMVDDPKWRLIARKSGASEAEVIAVFVRMMTVAGRSDDKGSIAGWDAEVEATALGIDEASVFAIYEAMQGRVLTGDRLSGWERRQPSREDGSAERARQWRERKKNEEIQCERKRTQANADERPDKSREDKKEDTSLRSVSAAQAPATETRREKRSSRLPSDWQPDAEMVEYAVGLKFTPEEIRIETEKIRDWSVNSPNGAKRDWGAAWRNWMKSASERKTNAPNRQTGKGAELFSSNPRIAQAMRSLRDGGRTTDPFGAAPGGDTGDLPLGDRGTGGGDIFAQYAGRY